MFGGYMYLTYYQRFTKSLHLSGIQGETDVIKHFTSILHD